MRSPCGCVELLLPALLFDLLLSKVVRRRLLLLLLFAGSVLLLLLLRVNDPFPLDAAPALALPSLYRCRLLITAVSVIE